MLKAQNKSNQIETEQTKKNLSNAEKGRSSIKGVSTRHRKRKPPNSNKLKCGCKQTQMCAATETRWDLLEPMYLTTWTSECLWFLSHKPQDHRPWKRRKSYNDLQCVLMNEGEEGRHIRQIIWRPNVFLKGLRRTLSIACLDEILSFD